MHSRALLAATALGLFALSGCSEPDAPGPGPGVEDSGQSDLGTNDLGTETEPATETAAEDTPAPDATDDATSDATADTGVADTRLEDTRPDTSLPDVPLGDGGSPSSVRIHEVYVDRALEGDRIEFIELSGAPGTPVGNLWIRFVDSKGVVVWKLNAGDGSARIGPSGFWVIGVTRGDKLYSVAQFGFDNTGGSIQLTNDAVSASVAIDVLGYGAAPTTTATEPRKTIEGTAATLAANGSRGKTIGRKSVPGDSDNNGTDFCVMNETPGAANGPCL